MDRHFLKPVIIFVLFPFFMWSPVKVWAAVNMQESGNFQKAITEEEIALVSKAIQGIVPVISLIRSEKFYGIIVGFNHLKGTEFYDYLLSAYLNASLLTASREKYKSAQNKIKSIPSDDNLQNTLDISETKLITLLKEVELKIAPLTEFRAQVSKIKDLMKGNEGALDAYLLQEFGINYMEFFNSLFHATSHLDTAIQKLNKLIENI